MWKRIGLVIYFLISCFHCVLGAHLYPERVYQDYWCGKYGGKTEVRLLDNARVDCVLDDYAIEFDFANKWGESIGQSLYYGLSLNKKSGVVLIMEDYEKDARYLKRLSAVASLHGIKVWVLTPEELGVGSCKMN